VDRRAVPEDQQPASRVPDQVLEELYGMQPVERLRAHQALDPMPVS
jgi:hypothetical protein